MTLKFQFSLADEKLWLLPFPECTTSLHRHRSLTQIHAQIHTQMHTHRNTHRDNIHDTPTHTDTTHAPTQIHRKTHTGTPTRACRYTCLHTLNFKVSLQRPLPSCSNPESTLLPMFAAEMLFWALSLQHLLCEFFCLFFVWFLFPGYNNLKTSIDFFVLEAVFLQQPLEKRSKEESWTVSVWRLPAFVLCCL